ncbi:MAG TPA: glycosyltransferase [Solirubrobacter sp.]|nr:glycosyltransferase [Solirubrobacter sp.]
MPRVALYSHDAQGLGHVQRNLAIAAALASTTPAPDVLLFSGAEEAAALARPAPCDVVTLPALRKRLDGSYAPRHLSGGLAELVAVRSAVLASTLDTFAPDLLIVDKLPGGAFGELEPALERLRGRTRIVLGLRDVLDDPATTRREWREQRFASTIERWYDAIWVYGDPRVFDPVAEYGLAGRPTFTGYLAHGRGSAPAAGAPVVLGLVGGGQDGRALAECFAATRFPAGHRGVLVTGPQMPAADRARIGRIAPGRADLVVHEFVPDVARWIAGAAAVVSMGGYNTVCELLASATPGLVVPRIRPRTEQLIRARRLAARGALDCLDPAEVSPGALAAWLRRAVARERRPRAGLDLDGLCRVRALAAPEVAHAA